MKLLQFGRRGGILQWNAHAERGRASSYCGDTQACIAEMLPNLYLNWRWIQPILNITACIQSNVNNANQMKFYCLDQIANEQRNAADRLIPVWSNAICTVCARERVCGSMHDVHRYGGGVVKMRRHCVYLITKSSVHNFNWPLI